MTADTIMKRGHMQRKMQYTRNRIILWTAILLCAFFAGRSFAADANGGYEFRYGTVFSKGLVLSENQLPIWVTYNSDGDKVEEIGEAGGDLAGARVMSPTAYRALLIALDLPAPDFSDDIQSVLVSRTNDLLYSSADNIGYWADFYTEADGEKTWWGPIQGAAITAFDGRMPASSDGDGSYLVSYYIPPCPCFTFPYNHYVRAELRYRNFNPKSNQLGSYFVSRPAYDYCSGLSACPIGFTLTGAMTQTSMTGIEASIATNTYRKLDIPVDVAVLSGMAQLENEQRPGVQINPAMLGPVPQGDTRYAYVVPAYQQTVVDDTFLDFNGNGIQDKDPVYRDDGTVDIWFDTSDPTKDAPDISRIADFDPDVFDRGLVQQISTTDMLNTDIYVYRLSNDQLVTHRRGLYPNEVDTNTATPTLNYRFLFRGPMERVNDSASDWDAWQAASNISEELELWGPLYFYI